MLPNPNLSIAGSFPLQILLACFIFSEQSIHFNRLTFKSEIH